MITYTEEELKLAIEYACSYQKAEDYQEVGNITSEDFKNVDEADKAIGKALDYLCSAETISNQISIEEISEYIKSKK